MRRLLSKPRPFYVKKQGYIGNAENYSNYSGYGEYKYELYIYNLPSEMTGKTEAFFERAIGSGEGTEISVNNEIILGIDYYDSTHKDLYLVKKVGSLVNIYSLSYDDFALSYLHKELGDMDYEFEYLKQTIQNIDNSDTPIIREELI